MNRLALDCSFRTVFFVYCHTRKELFEQQWTEKKKTHQELKDCILLKVIFISVV